MFRDGTLTVLKHLEQATRPRDTIRLLMNPSGKRLVNGLPRFRSVPANPRIESKNGVGHALCRERLFQAFACAFRRPGDRLWVGQSRPKPGRQGF